ncbi:lysozyme inhibitor LprI family protein [Lacrimispora sp.]|uniref:lysozyme inhibitor LprI family protein n=1 Tax=Lacrimispora sp. TaxID=2719234 RepID=UPI002FDACAD5
MNKNRGIWIVIGSILVIGILITLATNNFVKSKENLPDSGKGAGQPAVLSQEAEESGSYGGQPELFSLEQADAPQEVSEDQVIAGKERPSTEEAGSSPESGEMSFSVRSFESPAPQAETEAVISPISPEVKARHSAESASLEGAKYYEKRLSELDIQVKRMWKESGDSNTYSMKALADKELKLWIREQDIIYDAVSEMLSEEDRVQMETSQQEWNKARDAKAQEAADKYSGGTLEEVEYTASLAESTRARAYDLLAEYGAVLSPSKNP